MKRYEVTGIFEHVRLRVFCATAEETAMRMEDLRRAGGTVFVRVSR